MYWFSIGQSKFQTTWNCMYMWFCLWRFLTSPMKISDLFSKIRQHGSVLLEVISASAFAFNAAGWETYHQHCHDHHHFCVRIMIMIMIIIIIMAIIIRFISVLHLSSVHGRVGSSGIWQTKTKQVFIKSWLIIIISYHHLIIKVLAHFFSFCTSLSKFSKKII